MLGAIAGAVAPAVLDYIGGRQANDANKDIAFTAGQMNMEEAARNREFQQASADKQMAFQNQMAINQMGFQERMSSTAHQREVQDLKAAGLNPMLSAMNGNGATSPAGAGGAGASAGGAQGSMPAATMQNVMSGFASAAKDFVALQKMGAEIKNLDADTKNKGSQSKLTENQAEQSGFWSDIMGAGRWFTKKFREAIESTGKNIPKTAPPASPDDVSKTRSPYRIRQY